MSIDASSESGTNPHVNWPLQIDLPESLEIKGSAYGHHITMVRRGDSLALCVGDQSWNVGLPSRAKQIRLGPTLGDLPFLIFPHPSVIVAPEAEVTLEVEVPLHLDLAAGGSRLRTLAPLGLARALYGPVDDGKLCWSVHENAAVLTELRIGGQAGRLSAVAAVTCHNRSTAPVEVTRIMVPQDMVGLYDGEDRIHLSDVTMTIVGDAEAELTIEPANGGRLLTDVLGLPIEPARRAFAFSHTYQTRTGLEYGF